MASFRRGAREVRQCRNDAAVDRWHLGVAEERLVGRPAGMGALGRRYDDLDAVGAVEREVEEVPRGLGRVRRQ